MITIIAINYRGQGLASMVFFNSKNERISDMPLSPERTKQFIDAGAVVDKNMKF